MHPSELQCTHVDQAAGPPPPPTLLNQVIPAHVGAAEKGKVIHQILIGLKQSHAPPMVSFIILAIGVMYEYGNFHGMCTTSLAPAPIPRHKDEDSEPSCGKPPWPLARQRAVQSLS